MTPEKLGVTRQEILEKFICINLDDVIDDALEMAAQKIDAFQDIVGWQPGESRNRLVCDIRDAVLAMKVKKADTGFGRDIGVT